jgi:hypothetical protein
MTICESLTYVFTCGESAQLPKGGEDQFITNYQKMIMDLHD